METNTTIDSERFHPMFTSSWLKTVAATVTAGLAVATAAQGGVIVTNQSINFTAADFSLGNTASKNWVINSNDVGAPNTPLWDHYTMLLGNGNIATQDASWYLDGFTTFKVASTAGAISSFTWGVHHFATISQGDDSFAWQYSTDNSSWHSFYTHSAGPVAADLLDQTYTVPLATPASFVYIRAVTLEGINTGDENYAVLWSAETGGGSNPNSFVTVTVVPEPGAAILLLAGLSSLLFARKSKPSKK